MAVPRPKKIWVRLDWIEVVENVILSSMVRVNLKEHEFKRL